MPVNSIHVAPTHYRRLFYLRDGLLLHVWSLAVFLDDGEAACAVHRISLDVLGEEPHLASALRPVIVCREGGDDTAVDVGRLGFEADEHPCHCYLPGFFIQLSPAPILQGLRVGQDPCGQEEFFRYVACSSEIDQHIDVTLIRVLLLRENLQHKFVHVAMRRARVDVQHQFR